LPVGLRNETQPVFTFYEFIKMGDSFFSEPESDHTSSSNYNNTLKKISCGINTLKQFSNPSNKKGVFLKQPEKRLFLFR